MSANTEQATSRQGAPPATHDGGTPRDIATWATVAGGLVLALLASLAMGAPDKRLPGIALTSSAMLVIERALVLFVAWLLVVVVLVEAWRGHLPLEVSGRGVRYAEASTTERIARDADAAIGRLEVELAWYRQEVDDLRRVVKTEASE